MQEINFFREDLLDKGQILNYKYYPTFFIVFVIIISFFSFDIYLEKIQSDDDVLLKEKELIFFVKEIEESRKLKNLDKEELIYDKLSLINQSKNMDALIKKTDINQYYLFFMLVKSLEDLGFKLESINLSGIDNSFNINLLSEKIIELKSINSGLSYDSKSSFKIEKINLSTKNEKFEYQMFGELVF